MDYSLLFFALFLTLIEMFAMYNLKKYNITKSIYFYLIGVILYAVVATLFCYSVNFEKLGSMNHAWNIGSSIIGFAIGYFIFNESLNGVEATGVALSLIGLLILALGNKNKVNHL